MSLPSFSDSSSAPLLVAHGLVKHYGDRRVLDQVGLTVRAGERVALTGPSGSGKSTLLNCLGGVDRPDEGTLLLQGLDLARCHPDELAGARRRHIGTVFQFFHLLPTLSAAENIALPLQLLGVPKEERIHRVTTLIERVGLEHRAQARPGQLSGGEQQRVALARALVHRPVLVLADEPTGALDSQRGAEVLALLREMTEEARAALVLVTHSEEATSICHRTLHLRDGRIVESVSTSS